MIGQTRSEIADLLKRHGLRPKQSLGQHFLADANLTRKIVAVAEIQVGDRVVEVGAGTGTLTAALAEAGARVVAFEVDEGLRPVLEQVTSGLDVDLRFGDVTKVDFAEEFANERWAMVANLPYNIGTPLVLEVLRRATSIVLLVVMVQREVAERLVASPGGPAYGLPSVVVGLHSEARLAFRVPPQVFIPPPRVESAVVVMRRKPSPPLADRAVELARAGFAQRRKMLRRSLAPVLADPTEALGFAGIDPTSRAEDLAPETWLELAEVM